MNCDLKTRLVHLYGKAVGHTRPFVPACAAGPGGFPGRLAGLAARVRLLAIALEAHGTA